MDRFIGWLNHHRPYYMDLLRVYLGVGLLVKGCYFVANTQFLVDTLGTTGTPMAGPALAHLIGAIHIVGGAFMAIGFLTRFAIAAQIPILTGAVFLVHLREGLFAASQGLEFTAFVLFTLLLLFAYGPGHLSADHVIFRRKTEPSR